MQLIQGKIERKTVMSDYGNKFEIVNLELSVDELCKGNTPATNFWGFCLLNNLVEKKFPDLEYDPDDPDCDKYVAKVDPVDLIYSEDKEKNARVLKMFENWGIATI
jgi:hypothetical protein